MLMNRMVVCWWLNGRLCGEWWGRLNIGLFF